MATTITAAAANSMSAALNTYVNTGGAAKIRIYDATGGAAANVNASLGTNVLLAEFTLDATAFTSSNGVLTLNTVPKTVAAAASGTAAHFRLVNSAGTAILQGSVGTSSAQLILNTVTITSGVNVTITSGTITVPQS